MQIEEVAEKLLEIEQKVARSLPGKAEGPPADLIRQALADARKRGVDVETGCSIPDPSLHRVFVALCARYSVEFFRRPRQREDGVTVRAPEAFVRQVLGPIFEEMSLVIDEWHVERTEAVLREFGAPLPPEAEES